MSSDDHGSQEPSAHLSREEPAWLDRLKVEQPALRRLGSYWQSLRRGRPMPERADIEPWAIPDLLPDLWIWSVQRQPRAFHLRLAGDRISRLVGEWKRGSELAEAAPRERLPLLRLRFERVAFGPALVRASGYARLGPEHAVPVRAERLMLPLGRSTEEAEDILGITWYEELADGGPLPPEELDEICLALDALGP